MRFSGILKWDDNDGNRGEIAEFHNVIAENKESAERAVIEEKWDKRLNSTLCMPFVTFTTIDDE